MNQKTEPQLPPERTAVQEPEKGLLPAGTVLGKCELRQLAGRGGMGAIYRARHTGLEQERAVKVMDPSLNFSHQKRFLREARLAANLNHPNIIQVYNVDQQGPWLFLEMEYVDGYDGRALLRRQPRLPFAAAGLIVGKVAEALAYAHQARIRYQDQDYRGIVHRDIKPENILLRRDGEVKLADFGIARAAEASNDTATGTILGTCAYMSLEQLDNLSLDGRTDIYSLGVVLYELLTGEQPYQGETATQVIRKIMEHKVVPVSKLNPQVPAAASRLVEAMMEPQKARRLADAGEVARRLREILSPEFYGQHRLHLQRYLETGSAPAPAVPRRRRWPYLAAAAAAGGLGFLLFLGRGPRSAQPPPPAPVPATQKTAPPLRSAAPASPVPPPSAPPARPAPVPAAEKHALASLDAVQEFIRGQPDAYWKKFQPAALLRRLDLAPGERARACYQLAKTVLEKKGGRAAAQALLAEAAAGSRDAAIPGLLARLRYEEGNLVQAQAAFSAALAGHSAWENDQENRGRAAYHLARINEQLFQQGKPIDRGAVLKSWQLFLRDYGNYPPLADLARDAKQRMLQWL